MVAIQDVNVPTTDFHILQFVIQRRLFCIELSHVFQIINFVALQAVPGMPVYFKGLLNLHGAEVPVIDIAARLEMIQAAPVYTLNTPIIICQHNHQLLGLIVDEVLAIELIQQESLQMQEVFNQQTAVFLKGALQTRRGDALLLDMDKIADFQLS